MSEPGSNAFRIEKDGLGEMELPAGAYYGIHTRRAMLNFPLSDSRIHERFICAFGQVKEACAAVNMKLGFMDDRIGRAVLTACRDVSSGKFNSSIVGDPYQGGAGTSTNMNFNEVIANRSVEILGGELGDYGLVHPVDHVNMHQSTNDVYPTALKVAVLALLVDLEKEVAKLQEELQQKEDEFSRVVKVGRTQLMDAVPMTMGMTFGAFADAVARDRWRIFKCRERIKKVNLGGTAVGTGLGAPRDYILQVAGELKNICGLPVSRAENLIDATQNSDSFVEVSGMLKSYAANLMKISNDLRLLGSGPAAGLAEIRLPARQCGSSIMAGKINPVIPESVAQVALQVMGNDQTITLAASMAQLELNQFMPLLAHNLLSSLSLLLNVTRSFTRNCVQGITAAEDRCREHVESSYALGTVLVPVLGYDSVEKLVVSCRKSGRSLREEIIYQGIAGADEVDELLSPQRLCKQGFTPDEVKGVRKI
ncbi:aspartate ammonia-lyase [Desulfovibrio sp. JC010]|uniref:aspartate ammonia-lyase n=1 Tax=Desulfovibrio sp. JC010 TaxID=2593641 RepID=UPI0013D2EE63|nr:aspartate ammonia-lyase [Desulfovibrio sp. JC010]NDV28164.1 aspartate ammonia-lyase [Desulfovibrio sp. JC010]